MLGFLNRPGLAGPAPVPIRQHRAALVRIDRRGGRAHADRAVVQPVRQDHQVGGEPVPAHVRGLPHLPGCRAARVCASGAPNRAQQALRLACVQTRNTGSSHTSPNEGTIPPLAPSGHVRPVPELTRTPPRVAKRAPGPRSSPGTPNARRPPADGRPADHLHPQAELLRRLQQRRQRRGLRGLGRLVRPRARVLDQQPGPGRLRRRGRRGFGAVVALRTVLANSGHAGQPPITVSGSHMSSLR